MHVRQLAVGTHFLRRDRNQTIFLDGGTQIIKQHGSGHTDEGEQEFSGAKRQRRALFNVSGFIITGIHRLLESANAFAQAFAKLG
jgi:hypothetical protein